MAEELGWTITDCLNHKLSFKKKEDPKAKHEAMGQHIKRLRAAGWYLSHSIERYTSYLVITMIIFTSCLEICLDPEALLLDLPVATRASFSSRQMLVHVSGAHPLSSASTCFYGPCITVDTLSHA